MALLAPPSTVPAFQKETREASKDGDGDMEDTEDTDMVTVTEAGDMQHLMVTL